MLYSGRKTYSPNGLSLLLPYYSLQIRILSLLISKIAIIFIVPFLPLLDLDCSRSAQSSVYVKSTTLCRQPWPRDRTKDALELQMEAIDPLL